MLPATRVGGLEGLPAAGAEAVAEVGLTLPPERMPMWRYGRLLKRWAYVGLYGPDAMVCAGVAHIGPITQRFWAVALPDGTVRDQTVLRGGTVEVSQQAMRFESKAASASVTVGRAGDQGQTASPAGRGGYAWTRKTPVRGRGSVEVEGRTIELDCAGIVDESAGYHDRHVEWRWSAGVGRAESGEAIAWNLVDGIHDDDRASERRVWVDGEARPLGRCDFADDLSGVRIEDGGDLRFTSWGAREDRTNVLILRSFYRQPFGTFAGDIGGLRLAEGFGVMEHHDVYW